MRFASRALAVLAAVSLLAQPASAQSVLRDAETEALLDDLAAPLVQAAKRLGGGPLMGLVSIGTNLSAFATAFGMIVMTPRYVAALGSDGGLAARLAALDQRSVPRTALFWSAALVALLASSERLGSLFVLSSSAVLLQYVSTMASLVTLAWRGHVGLSRLWIAPALSSLLAVAFLARAVDRHELIALGLTLLAGTIAAWFSARAKRRPAR